MKSAKLSKSPLLIILIIALLAGVAYFGTDYFATVSFSGTPVNINFGKIPENNPDGILGRFYVGNALLDGNSAEYVFVPKDMTYREAMALQFTAKKSVWMADLLNPATNILYYEIDYDFGYIPVRKEKPVPFQEVNMGNPRFVLSADIKLGMPDGTVQYGSVGNTGDYVQRFDVKDASGKSRTIYIRYNELSFKSGDLPPSGDLSVLKSPTNDYRLIKESNLKDGTGLLEGYECTVGTWNCYAAKQISLGKYSYADDYSDYFNWMVSNSKIPEVVPRGAYTSNPYDVVNNQVLVYYDSTTFTQSVTFYIPEELAEFIFIGEQTPEFKFEPILDTGGNEGQTILVHIKGTAISSGTIKLYLDGSGVESYTIIGGSEKQIITGKPYDFPAYVKLSQVNTGVKLPINVYSQPSGMGGPTQITFYVDIKDTTGATYYNLNVKCIDTNNKIVSNAEIYVDNVFVGYGQTTKSVTSGVHYIYANNVTGWYSGYNSEHQKYVSVTSDTTIEIPFTIEPPKDTSLPLWMYVLFGIFGIGVLGFVLLILKELGIKIEATHILILIAIIIFAALAWYFIQALEGLSDAIGAWKPW